MSYPTAVHLLPTRLYTTYMYTRICICMYVSVIMFYCVCERIHFRISLAKREWEGTLERIACGLKATPACPSLCMCWLGCASALPPSREGVQYFCTVMWCPTSSLKTLCMAYRISQSMEAVCHKQLTSHPLPVCQSLWRQWGRCSLYPFPTVNMQVS